MTLEKKYKLNFLWKTNKPIPRKLQDGRTGGRKDARTEGWKDGWTDPSFIGPS